MRNAQVEIRATHFHSSTFAWFVQRKNSYFTALTIHITILKKEEVSEFSHLTNKITQT